jgi:hypothetical protein
MGILQSMTAELPMARKGQSLIGQFASSRSFTVSWSHVKALQ